MSKGVPKQRYLNRELSWLEFDQRVLDEATDESLPLLERLKFLAITGSNLDEFFRVRVGGLQQMVQQGLTRPDPAGLTPKQQLEAISTRVRELVETQYQCYLNDLEPKLSAAGVKRVRGDGLNQMQRRILRQVFENEVFPILTPAAVTSADDFPLLPNQALAVCVRLAAAGGTDEHADRFAVIPFGPAASRFLPLPSEPGVAHLLLEDAVQLFADRFFVGEKVLECVPFRITRNADIGVREDLAGDLLDEMEHVLHERRLGDCVRIEIASTATETLLNFLVQVLAAPEDQIYRIPGPLDLAAFFRVAEQAGFDNLKYEAWPPQASPDCPPGEKLCDLVAQRDIMLLHPYESFEPVVRLIEEAAVDPDVLAIKQTLYRTSRDSPIVAALMRAAENGKHVTAIVELKARFDEARNMAWARRLELAGAQVIYGVKGLKTHAKCCLIVRRGGDQGIQRIVHFGTGNYNESTARLYSDVSLMTADSDLGEDAVSFFNAITGYSQPQRFRKLEAAPLTLRDTLLDLIQVEIEQARDGLPARILAKVNALVDPVLIDALYQASQAGVQIKLNVRGVCCLRPGVKKLSENIEVVCIVDRFLEHARIISFHHGGDPRVFIGSADWMPRNLDRRIELLVPVEDPRCVERLTDVLGVYFADNVKARRLLPDGSHARLTPDDGEPTVRSQQELYERIRANAVADRKQRRTVFEPHLPPDADE
ncbi:MAG: polyphosphate kinase 1 [Planctomycetaceae bacterium]